MKETFLKLQPWLGLIARLTLGVVLFLAGYLKVDELEISQMAVRAYEMLPISVANFLGIVIPFFELAIGLLLILGAATRLMAALGGALMVVFIIAIAQAWARGLSIDCGCFGGGGTIDPSETRYLQEIIRDAGLALLGFYLVRYPLSKFSIDKNNRITNSGEME